MCEAGLLDERVQLELVVFDAVEVRLREKDKLRVYIGGTLFERVHLVLAVIAEVADRL